MPSHITPEQLDQNSRQLIKACRSGNLDAVNQLLPVSDPKAFDSAALHWAAIDGRIAIVKLLIPVSEPQADDSKILQIASAQGHTDIVKMLLPHSDAKAKRSRALLNAAINGHVECMTLLIPVSDCNTVLKDLNKYKNDTTVFQKCVDEYETLQQKERLCSSLSGIKSTQYNASKRKI